MSRGHSSSLRASGSCPPEPTPEVQRALHLVLIVVFARDEAREMCPTSSDEWPSSYYTDLTRRMLDSETAWTWVSRCLDERLSPWLSDLESMAPVRIASLVSEGRESWAAEDWVAVVWSLLRRGNAGALSVLTRVAAEAEVAVLRLAVRRVPTSHIQPIPDTALRSVCLLSAPPLGAGEHILALTYERSCIP